MRPYFLSASIVSSSIVVYQICMKVIPEGVNPVSALLTFYLSALVCTLAAAPIFKLQEGMLSLSNFTLPAVLVGVAIVGIEFGYLYMYRSGWTLSAAPLMGMGSAAVAAAKTRTNLCRGRSLVMKVSSYLFELKSTATRVTGLSILAF